MDSTPSERCSKVSRDWGPCSQPAGPGGLCSAHAKWALRLTEFQAPDPYYEQKIVRGLTSPTWDWMTDEEAEILLNGRQRGDGRRLDSWVAGDAVGWTGS